ncbi:ABC transporter [Streptomyces daqingensis]|uniref:ABC transporter n=1 Tax=Streptomyces daqingensis TaxID=1472640 RepID=A0ABQ2M5S3_9ACTN|nr:ABC transporter permease subunit [Streptomyces daqingensis]GGO47186.1 ABC transporter [Streptomyces daqingensis]
MSDTGAAVAFEWTKIRTLRSTVWSLALFSAASVVVALLFGYVMRGTYADLDAAAQARFDPVASGFSGMKLGMIALVVFGVLTVSSEYSTGSIRSSLAAVPRRGVFYAAKLLTGTATALVVSAVVVTLSFFAAQTMLGSPASVSLSDDGVLRALIGGVLYMTLICAFSMGLASVLRSSALTMGILVPLFFMISTILNSIPGVQKVAQFLPDLAGSLILRSKEPHGDGVLTAWTGMAVLAAWAVLAVAAGYFAMRRRDA